MDIKEYINGTVETWSNGIRFLATISKVEQEPSGRHVYRSSVTRHVRNGEGELVFEPCFDNTTITLPTSTDGIPDQLGLGRRIFETEHSGLIILYPPGLDPKEPLPRRAV